MVRALAGIVAALLIASDASAWGEVFAVNVRAFGYCEGLPALRAGTRTTAPVWLRLDGADAWTISLSPGFEDDTSARLYIDEFVGSERGGNVHVTGTVKFTDEGGEIAFNGLLFHDARLGGWRRFRAYFNQTDVFGQGCRWAGKLITKSRLN